MVARIKKRRLSAYYTFWRSGQPIIVSIRKQPTPVNVLRHDANVNACASPSHDNSCNGPDSSQRTELALKICIKRYRFFFTLQPDVGISFYSSFLSSWKMNIRAMMIKGKSQPPCATVMVSRDIPGTSSVRNISKYGKRTSQQKNKQDILLHSGCFCVVYLFIADSSLR